MPSADVKAVLFDFSGTLAALEHEGWGVNAYLFAGDAFPAGATMRTWSLRLCWA